MSCAHIWVVSDIADANTRLGICVKDLLNEVLALRGEELGHLVVSCHDFLVQIGCLRVLEWQIACDHGIKDYTTRPDICLKTVISLSSNHLKVKQKSQYEFS